MKESLSGLAPQYPPLTPTNQRLITEVDAMQWEFIVALIIAIPIILFPAAFVWYLNVGGIYAVIKEVRERRAAREAKTAAAEAKQHVAAPPKQ